MALSIIVGKPGSGKSYYCVENLAKQVEDWVRYELAEGHPFERLLLTNIPVKVDALNEYLSDKIGEPVDASHYVKILTDADFGAPTENPNWTKKEDRFLYWWDTFPDKSLIVIDEVHHYLGEEQEMKWTSEAQDYNTSFRNWLSTHRHKGQDVIFLTQHTDNIATSVLRLAEKCYEITNAKSQSLPFPLSIPLSDVDVVREAWGYETQLFRVSVGLYRGRAIRYDGDVTTHVMSQKVFRLYKSHTLSDVSSDRPSLNLGKVGSLFWFARQHGFHLSVKAVFLVFGGWAAMRFLFALPLILSAAFAPGEPDATKSSAGHNVSKMNTAEGGDIPAFRDDRELQQMRVRLKDAEQSVTRLSEDKKNLIDEIQKMKDEKTKIIGLYPGGVLTKEGRKKVGASIEYEGISDFIKVVNVREGKVLLTSGKELEL